MKIISQRVLAGIGLILAILPGVVLIPLIGFGFFVNLITYNTSQNDIVWLWGGSLVSFLLAVVSLFWPRVFMRVALLLLTLYIVGVFALMEALQLLKGNDRRVAVVAAISALALYTVSLYSVWQTTRRP